MKRILLVEDNQEDVDLVLQAFKESSLEGEITVISSGDELLHYLHEQLAYRPDRMPELIFLTFDALERRTLNLLERLRAEQLSRLIPIVILSNSDSEEDQLMSYELGANSYVRKPVERERFIVLIQQIGHYWLHLNQSPPSD